MLHLLNTASHRPLQSQSTVVKNLQTKFKRSLNSIGKMRIVLRYFVVDTTSIRRRHHLTLGISYLSLTRILAAADTLLLLLMLWMLCNWVFSGSLPVRRSASKPLKAAIPLISNREQIVTEQFIEQLLSVIVQCAWSIILPYKQWTIKHLKRRVTFCLFNSFKPANISRP